MGRWWMGAWWVWWVCVGAARAGLECETRAHCAHPDFKALEARALGCAPSSFCVRLVGPGGGGSGALGGSAAGHWGRVETCGAGLLEDGGERLGLAPWQLRKAELDCAFLKDGETACTAPGLRERRSRYADLPATWCHSCKARYGNPLGHKGPFQAQWINILGCPNYKTLQKKYPELEKKPCGGRVATHVERFCVHDMVIEDFQLRLDDEPGIDGDFWRPRYVDTVEACCRHCLANKKCHTWVVDQEPSAMAQAWVFGIVSKRIKGRRMPDKPMLCFMSAMREEEMEAWARADTPQPPDAAEKLSEELEATGVTDVDLMSVTPKCHGAGTVWASTSVVYGHRRAGLPYRSAVGAAESVCCCRAKSCEAAPTARQFRCRLSVPVAHPWRGALRQALEQHCRGPEDRRAESPWCWLSLNHQDSSLFSACQAAAWGEPGVVAGLAVDYADVHSPTASPGYEAWRRLYQDCGSLRDGEELCWLATRHKTDLHRLPDGSEETSKVSWTETQCCCKKERCDGAHRPKEAEEEAGEAAAETRWSGALTRDVECQLDMGTLTAESLDVARLGYWEAQGGWWRRAEDACGTQPTGLTARRDAWCFYNESTSAGYYVAGCRGMLLEEDAAQELAAFRRRCDALSRWGEEICEPTPDRVRTAHTGLPATLRSRLCCCKAMRCSGSPQDGYRPPGDKGEEEL